MDLDAKMYQLAQLEYRAGHDVSQAMKNLRKLFGYHSINLETVQRWFTYFESKKISKFVNTGEYENKLVKEFPDGAQSFLSGMISQVNIGFSKLKTFDGRIAYGISNNEFVVIDVFHGRYKSIPFSHGMEHRLPLEFIDSERFLVFDYGTARLHLYKFDFDVSTLGHLDSMKLDRRLQYSSFVLDESDANRFIIHANRSFCVGKVIGNKIEVGEVNRLEVAIQWPGFNGSKLQFVRPINLPSCKLYEFDLDSMEMTSTYTPTKFSDGKKFRLSMSHFAYSWLDHYLYVAYKTKDGYWKVAVLDTKMQEWHDTHVQTLTRIRKLFIDRDGFLTVITGEPISTRSFYRFPLKKPDSLVNLAWFSYTSKFKTTGEHGNLFNCLPYTCHLRLDLPGVEEESDVEDQYEQQSDMEED